jgi:hypothetical protein
MLLFVKGADNYDIKVHIWIIACFITSKLFSKCQSKLGAVFILKVRYKNHSHKTK